MSNSDPEAEYTPSPSLRRSVQFQLSPRSARPKRNVQVRNYNLSLPGRDMDQNTSAAREYADDNEENEEEKDEEEEDEEEEDEEEEDEEEEDEEEEDEKEEAEEEAGWKGAEQEEMEMRMHDEKREKVEEDPRVALMNQGLRIADSVARTLTPTHENSHSIVKSKKVNAKVNAEADSSNAPFDSHLAVPDIRHIRRDQQEQAQAPELELEPDQGLLQMPDQGPEQELEPDHGPEREIEQEPEYQHKNPSSMASVRSRPESPFLHRHGFGYRKAARPFGWEEKDADEEVIQGGREKLVVSRKRERSVVRDIASGTGTGFESEVDTKMEMTKRYQSIFTATRRKNSLAATADGALDIATPFTNSLVQPQALYRQYIDDVLTELRFIQEKLPWAGHIMVPISWTCKLVSAIVSFGLFLVASGLRLIPWGLWTVFGVILVVASAVAAVCVVVLYLATGIGRSIEASDMLIATGGLRMLGGLTGYKKQSWTTWTDDRVCPLLPFEGRIPWTDFGVCGTPVVIQTSMPEFNLTEMMKMSPLKLQFRPDNEEWLLILEKEKVAIATINKVNIAKTKWENVHGVLNHYRSPSDSEAQLPATIPPLLSRLLVALDNELAHLYNIPTRQGLVLSKTRSTIRRADNKCQEHERNPLSKREAKSFHGAYVFELSNIGGDLGLLIESLGFAIDSHEEAARIIKPLTEEAARWIQACDAKRWPLGLGAWVTGGCDQVWYKTMQELGSIERQEGEKLLSIHHSAKLSLARLMALLKEVTEQPGSIERIPYHTESLMAIFSFHTKKNDGKGQG